VNRWARIAAIIVPGSAVLGGLAFAWRSARAPSLAPRVPHAEIRDAREPADAAAPTPSRPKRMRSYNVVLVTVDTLRADLGYAGYPRPVTPNIDALAARSVVFERAYALASYTAKSIGPMLIGRYASETWRDSDHFVTFFPQNVFVAERAQAMGVRTFAGMSHVAFKWRTGLDQGFEVWDTSAVLANQSLDDTSVTSARMTDAAISMLAHDDNTRPAWPVDAGPPEGAEGEPRRFFAWFHYFDPHLPYVAHKGAPDFASIDAGKLSRPRALYDEEVWFTDQQIGRLLEFIGTRPWSAETAIVLTSDHGEAFGEHGVVGHGRELWEPLVRVPLLLHVPGAEPRRIAQRRSLIDLAPTILDLLGGSPPEDGSLRGTSLVPDAFAAADAAIAARDVYIDMPSGPFNETRRALVTGPGPGLKLISFRDERYALYDLAKDPDELDDLSANQELLAPVLDKYRALKRSLQEIPPAPPK
jgi:arylsulfatase A-like enzyme